MLKIVTYITDKCVASVNNNPKYQYNHGQHQRPSNTSSNYSCLRAVCLCRKMLHGKVFFNKIQMCKCVSSMIEEEIIIFNLTYMKKQSNGKRYIDLMQSHCKISTFYKYFTAISYIIRNFWEASLFIKYSYIL